jgi:hypothetical protein
MARIAFERSLPRPSRGFDSIIRQPAKSGLPQPEIHKGSCYRAQQDAHVLVCGWLLLDVVDHQHVHRAGLLLQLHAQRVLDRVEE